MSERVVYIAGPYTGPQPRPDDYLAIDRNIANAREAAAELARCGIRFFCPHLHSAHFEAITPQVPPEFWYELDIHFLKACDVLLLLPGWQSSKGTMQELAIAQSRDMPTYENISDLVESEFSEAQAQGGRR